METIYTAMPSSADVLNSAGIYYGTGRYRRDWEPSTAVLIGVVFAACSAGQWHYIVSDHHSTS